jgi:mRNA interferase RelE/StbE
MYRVEVRRQAQRALDKLPKSDFEAVVHSITDLTRMPRPRGIEKVKSTGLWRIRQGDYRIVYAIDDDAHIVTVVRVGHRREIYRAL